MRSSHFSDHGWVMYGLSCLVLPGLKWYSFYNQRLPTLGFGVPEFTLVGVMDRKT